MTRQVTEGSPITIVARSQVGGFIPDAALNIDGEVFSNPELSEGFEEHRANGAGEFTFYAAPGSVVTVRVDDPIAVDVEPVQVVGVAGRPGGIAAVHPDNTPAVHEESPLSEHVTDSSLVGAVAPGDALAPEDGGAAAMVGVDRAQNVPPTEPVAEPTPDGTAATDADSVAPAATQSEQVTPQYEPQPTEGGSTVAPEQVTTTDQPQPVEAPAEQPAEAPAAEPAPSGETPTF